MSVIIDACMSARRTDHYNIIFLHEQYIHVVVYSECFITDARVFWRSV